MNESRRTAIHRTLILSLLALAYLSLLPLPASAADPLHKLLGCSVPDCIGRWCPDDYCPKRQPCVGVSLCFGCDDYCAKKEPCVCTPLCFGCDDYCKKCLPKVCTTPRCQSLRCGATQCDRAASDEWPCDALAGTLLQPEKNLGGAAPAAAEHSSLRLPPVIVAKPRAAVMK